MSVLKRQGRKLRQTLKALTDPQPEFVSLVFGGANKTPFRAIRADGSSVNEASELVDASTKSIARVEFSGATFADEAAVKSWLANGGYDPDMPIQKTDTGFMVDSDLDPKTVLTVIDMMDAQGIKLYTVADKSPALELTEKMALHPGALVELTMGLYENVRKSIGDGGDIHGAVQNFLSNVEALVATLPPKTDSTFDILFSSAAPELEVEKIDNEKAQKVGARNNANDQKMIQSMHDNAVQLGATCASDMSDGDENLDVQMDKADISDSDVPHSNPQPYGNVKYADPKNGKYPIDTEEHIRAAWNYINKGTDSGKYSASELKAVKSRIIAAWKKVIDPAGPPSAQQKEATMSEEAEDANETAEKAVTPGGPPIEEKKPKPAKPKSPVGQQEAEEDGEGEANETADATQPKKKKGKKPEADAEEGADAEDAEDEADGGDDEAAEGEDPNEDAEEAKKKPKKKEDSAADEATETDPVAALTVLVTELTASVKSMQENLSGEIGKVVERVAAVEETRQTRKGADVDDASTATPNAAEVSKGISDLRTKNMLGMRRPVSR